MISQQIIIEFTKGDAGAFGKIYCEYFSKAVSFAIYYVWDSEVARDIVHDVFVSLWENRENIDASRNIEPYIITSTKNRCINYLRDTLSRKKTRDVILQKNLEALESRSLEEVYMNDLQQFLRNTLSQLPAKTQEAFILNRFHNMSYEQIAAHQQVSLKNIEYRIMSALRVLRQQLKDFNNG